MVGRLTRTNCDEAGDYVVPNELSPTVLVSRPDTRKLYNKVNLFYREYVDFDSLENYFHLRFTFLQQ